MLFQYLKHYRSHFMIYWIDCDEERDNKGSDSVRIFAFINILPFLALETNGN